MKKFLTWSHLMAKRQLKNPLLLVLLLLIPVVSLIARNYPSQETEGAYKIGVYVDGKDELSLELADTLYDYSGSYSFYEYKDLDKMYRDVKNESIVSGYILPDNLTELTNEDSHEECILVIHQPGLTTQASINEIVYANLIKIQGRLIISNYAEDSGLFDDFDTDYIEELMTYYEKYLGSDVTFHIVFNTYGISGEEQIENTSSAKLVFPARGILAVLIFLASMLGAILWRRDMEKGVFNTVSSAYKNVCLGLYVFFPTLLFSVVSLISLGILGSLVYIGKEISAMLLLMALCMFSSLVVVKITRTSKICVSLVPIILLCCLVVCPVFIQADTMIPAVKYIEKIFAPYYYLRMFI